MITGNYENDAKNLISTLEENGFKVIYDATELERHGIYVMVRNKEIGYNFAPCVTFPNWGALFYFLCGVHSLYFKK